MSARPRLSELGELRLRVQYSVAQAHRGRVHVDRCGWLVREIVRHSHTVVDMGEIVTAARQMADTEINRRLAVRATVKSVQAANNTGKPRLVAFSHGYLHCAGMPQGRVRVPPRTHSLATRGVALTITA